MTSEKIQEYFKNRLIGIMTKSIKGSQRTEEGESLNGNAVLSGWYLDEDKYFIFIGTEDGIVEEAVHKKDIVRIFLVDPYNEFNESSIEQH